MAKKLEATFTIAQCAATGLSPKAALVHLMKNAGFSLDAGAAALGKIKLNGEHLVERHLGGQVIVVSQSLTA